MSRRTGRAAGAAACLALVFWLAACSDSKSADTTAGSSATTEAVATTVAAADTTADATPDDTSADDTVVDDATTDDTFPVDTFPDETADPNAPGIGTEFCDVSDELNQSDFDPFTATADQIEAYFTVDFPDMFGRLVVATPPELADDVTTVGAFYAQLTAELEANGWDMNAAFENPAIQETMGGTGMAEAGENLDAYCGY